MTILPNPHDAKVRDNRFSARVLQLYAATGLPTVLDVKAATATTAAEILLYNEIGGYGVTAQSFATALKTAGDGELTIRINSPGGDAFDAHTIYNAIRSRKTPVTMIVDGLAASAASLIAMAGTTIKMHENAMMMIHNAHTFTAGDRHEMEASADILSKVDGIMAGIYASRSKSTQEEAASIMDRETWLTATEAKARKFCDEIVSQPSVSALSTGEILALDIPRIQAACDSMGALDSINDAIGSLSEAIDCLMPTDPEDDQPAEPTQMSTGKQLRLRKLQLVQQQL